MRLYESSTPAQAPEETGAKAGKAGAKAAENGARAKAGAGQPCVPLPQGGARGGHDAPPRRKTLEDVVMLRLAFCLLIVMYHALCPFGIWEAVEGIGHVEAYRRLGLSLVNLAIPGFVFISGYLLGYISRSEPQALRFNGCVARKVRRLVIPSVVFSAAYLCLYAPRAMSTARAAYEAVNGYAHLWFLPMLFNCFVVTWLLNRLRFEKRLPLFTAVVILAALCPGLHLPFQASETLRYYLYFYMGFGLQRGCLDVLKTPATCRPALYCAAAALAALALAETAMPAAAQWEIGGGVITC